MKYEDMEMAAWDDEVAEADEERLGLDEGELARIQYLAEHPELADPIIAFLPDHDGSRRRGGGTQ